MPRFRARGTIRIDVTAADTKEAGEKAKQIAEQVSDQFGKVHLRIIGPNVILERLL